MAVSINEGVKYPVNVAPQTGGVLILIFEVLIQLVQAMF